MCGIVGMFGNLNFQTNKMFRDMQVFDSVRGVDSTGVVTIPYGTPKNVQVDKELGLPDNLWIYGQENLFDDKGILRSLKTAIIGHNRAATIGKVTVDNAHPFEFDNVVGVHNGTLRDYKDLDSDTHAVDSISLFSHINKFGLEDAWKKFTGAAAVVFWDKSDGTIHIARNRERPLCYMYNEKKDAIFFASEYWMITIAAQRAGVKLFCDAKDKKPLYYEFEENKHYHYSVTGTGFKLLLKEEMETKPVNFMKQTGITPTVGVQGNMGFPKSEFKSRQTRSKASKKANDQFCSTINLQWAQGLEKAPKEIRGQEFTVEGYAFRSETDEHSREEFFRCRFLDKNILECLEVIPEDLEQYQSLSRQCGRGSVFRIEARPRMALDGDGNVMKYRVSAAHIKMLGENVVAIQKTKEPISEPMTVSDLFQEDEEDVPEEGFFKIYQNFRATRDEWQNAVTSSGGCCYCCGNPTDETQSSNLLWFGPSKFACKDCQEEDWFTQAMYNIGG